MALIPQCDNCGEIYKGGFSGHLKKVVARTSKQDFVIDINIRPPHLCAKCFRIVIKEALKKK